MITPLCRIVRRNFVRLTPNSGSSIWWPSICYGVDKANSASTCSCSQGSRFALSCSSDSPAASCSICSGVANGGGACRSSLASRVDRLMGGLRHVLRLRSERRDRSSLWAPLGTQLRRSLPDPSRAMWRVSGDMAGVATAATTAPGISDYSFVLTRLQNRCPPAWSGPSRQYRTYQSTQRRR